MDYSTSIFVQTNSIIYSGFLNDMCDEFSVEVRNGDTSMKDRARQAKNFLIFLLQPQRVFSC